MFFSRKEKAFEFKFSSLHDAVEAGDLKEVECYLKNGNSVHQLDSRGAPCIHVAAARGHTNIVKLFIDYGVDVNFLINEGGTPLMAACSCLQAKMVEFLLEHGADPNIKGQGGRTALICTFKPRVTDLVAQSKCINLLVRSGARVNDRTNDGGTALMDAAWFGNRDAVIELLHLGADPKLRDENERTAAMLAFERGHDELAKMLTNR
jgi:uncharacterized protein